MSEPSRSENQSPAKAEQPTEPAPSAGVTSLAPDAAHFAPEAASAAVPASPPQVSAEQPQVSAERPQVSAEQPQVSAEQEPPGPALPAATVSALLNRGNAMLAHGDVSAARLLYRVRGARLGPCRRGGGHDLRSRISSPIEGARHNSGRKCGGRLV